MVHIVKRNKKTLQISAPMVYPVQMKEEQKNQYNTRIQSMRKARGWSLRQLAKQLDVSHNTITKWERASDGSDGLASKPTRAHMLRLSELFNVEPGWLLFGDSKEKSRTQKLTNKLNLLSSNEIDQIENMVDLLINAGSNGNEKGRKL